MTNLYKRKLDLALECNRRFGTTPSGALISEMREALNQDIEEINALARSVDSLIDPPQLKAVK